MLDEPPIRKWSIGTASIKVEFFKNNYQLTKHDLLEI